jgi:hypothetical protein
MFNDFSSLFVTSSSFLGSVSYLIRGTSVRNFFMGSANNANILQGIKIDDPSWLLSFFSRQRLFGFALANACPTIGMISGQKRRGMAGQCHCHVMR